MSGNLLNVSNLNKHFGGLHAVNNVSFNVSKGQIKAIIGPNGAGKTTLMNLISGSIISDSGTVTFNNRNIQKFKQYKIAEYGISRTYQNIRLFEGMTAVENVMVGRHTRSQAGFFACMFNMPWTWKEEKEIREYAMQMLEMLEITEHADTDVSNLSFGQQRAVEFARALAGQPKLLLLDEPAAGLNMRETYEIAGLISRIRDKGITILLVEHDMSLVMDISDEIVVLESGKKIADDEPQAIQKNQQVINIYLGDE
jgi:branched-chain amino acid transport system ATP-binding protein